ncbi:CHAD domain-containing protein [Aquipuribacter hungaricus]|uniref:CHAD domain-containing protein n=3 Tax=Aquipuribacter hungaricus TaxID=545624 RepID=A0ABV7WJ57_9MICO
MAEVVRETEQKFAVPEGFQVPDLVGAGPVTGVSGPQTHDLVAVYLDTDDLRLAREGITLRRREGGDDAGWHLKLPVGGSSRDEVRLPLDAVPDGGVPGELAGLVTAVARGLPLAPVATLRTTRSVTLLLSGEDVLAEVALDVVTTDVATTDVATGSTAGSTADGAARFAELELEQRPGTDGAALAEVVERLVAAGAEPGGLVPKLVQALRSRATAPSDVPPPPRHVPASAPAADLVRAHVATQVRALRAADLGVRRGEEDAVHQVRVAARRLRSGLRVFRPLLQRAWADDLRAELGWLAGELGGARDGEVLAERLQAALGDLPAEVDAATTGAWLDRTLATGADGSRTAALDALGSERYLRLLDRLVEAATTPAATDAAQEPCADALPPLVGKAWRRLAREAEALTLEGHDDDWHEARKSAKAVRYAAEAVAPALGKPAKKLARQVERVTELLGDHQDAAVAATALVRLTEAPGTDARAAFGLGVLYAAQRDDVRAAREDFVAVWPRVAHAKHRRWLER